MILHITWEIEDGYVGGSRPQHLDVDTDDWMDADEWENMPAEEKEDFKYERVQEAFDNKVSFYIKETKEEPKRESS
jgi:hypothetical protein